jgi:hypothetical protein
MCEQLHSGYVGAPSPVEADPYETVEHLKVLIGHVAALATLAACGDTQMLPGQLGKACLDMLAETALQADELAEELVDSLADWLNRREGT